MSHRSCGKSALIERLESRQLLAQTPFHGTPFMVTTDNERVTIQAEDFDNGGEGVAWHDTTAVNLGGKYRNTSVDISTVTKPSGGGFYVSNVKAGEWLEYSLNVVQEGGYNLLMSVSGIGDGSRF